MIRVRGNIIAFLMCILVHGCNILGMEPKSDKKSEAVPGFSFRRSDGVSRYIECPGFPLTREIAEKYKHGMSLINTVADGRITEVGSQGRIALLSLQEQQEFIKTTKAYSSPSVLGVACKVYAQTICRGQTMQSLFEDSAMAQTALEIGSPAEGYVAKLLNETFKEHIDALVLGSQDAVHRLYNISLHLDRQDSFLMPACLVEDVIYIKRDYFGKSESRKVVPLVPFALASGATCDFQILDHVKLSSIEETQKTDVGRSSNFFDSRTYKLSPDGSFLLGFCGSRDYDIDRMVFYNRNGEGIFQPIKAMQFSQGILARVHSLDRHESIKKVPLCMFLRDVQTSFAIRPHTRSAAFIDTLHNINVVDFDTEKTSQYAASGNALAVAWSPDGNVIAWSTSDCKLFSRMFNGATKEKVWSYDSQIRKIQWNRDGSGLLLMTDRLAYFVDAVDGKGLAMFGDDVPVVQATLSDDGAKLLIVQADKRISLWDIPSRLCVQTHCLDTANVIEITLSPDARYAGMSCEKNGTLAFYVWQLEEGIIVKYLEISDSSLHNVSEELKSGWPSFKTLSLPQMLLFVAASSAGDDKKFILSKDHYLAAQFNALAPHLKRYIERKIIVA